MTFTLCPDCKAKRVVVHAGTSIARIRAHQALDSSKRLTTCPGSGKRPTTALDIQ